MLGLEYKLLLNCFQESFIISKSVVFSGFMKLLFVYPINAKKTMRIAESISAGFQEKGWQAEFLPLELEKRNGKSKQPVEPELKPVSLDVSSFDVVAFGSPVFGLNPKRKVSKTIELFIKQCSGIEEKKAIVFLTCFGLAGTALKRVQGMLQVRNAKFVDSLIVTYLLGVSKKQLTEAKEFGKRLVSVFEANQ